MSLSMRRMEAFFYATFEENKNFLADFDRLKYMKRDEVLARLQEHQAIFRKLGVLSLYLFGSTAREDATEASDVDLLFDFEKGKLDLYDLMDLKEYAAHILG